MVSRGSEQQQEGRPLHIVAGEAKARGGSCHWFLAKRHKRGCGTAGAVSSRPFHIVAGEAKAGGNNHDIVITVSHTSKYHCHNIVISVTYKQQVRLKGACVIQPTLAFEPKPSSSFYQLYNIALRLGGDEMLPCRQSSVA